MSKHKPFKNHLAEVLEALPGMPDCSFDACFCDPPYGISFMGKGWDHGVPAKEVWAEVFRVLKPGAFLLAFGSSRTSHRLTCAIEDAGFEIRDSIVWVYATGFPKSHNISKALDKAAGAEREVVGIKPGHEGFANRGNLSSVQSLQGTLGGEGGFARPWMNDPEKVEAYHHATAPATPLAQLWDGYGTALKPAHEIIVRAQKPLTEQTERNIIVTNLNQLEAKLWSLLPVDVVEGSLGLSPVEQKKALSTARWTVEKSTSTRDGLLDQMDTSQFVLATTTCLSIVSSWRTTLGDHCARVSMSTTETVTGPTIDWKTLNSCLSALTPACIIQAEMKVPGARLSAIPAARYLTAVARNINATHELSVAGNAISPEDTKDLRLNCSPICVAMKPLDGTFANNATVHKVAGLNIDACRVGCGSKVITNHSRSAQAAVSEGKYGDSEAQDTHQTKGQTLGRWPANICHDGSAEVVAGFPVTSGGSAARFFYCAKASKGERNAGSQMQNFHPTVKPLSLCKYLATLCLPPKQDAQLRHLLVPFSGSGSEMIGGLLAGWDTVTGIEMEKDYIEIAEARLTHWYETEQHTT